MISVASASAQNAEETAFLTTINAQRAIGQSCGTAGYFAATMPLRLDSRLTAAAQLHSADIAARGLLTHTTRDGSSVSQRVARQSYAGTAGEVVSAGYTSSTALAQAMLGSASDCAYMMSPSVRDTGLGVAAPNGVTYRTVLLGAPAAAPPITTPPTTPPTAPPTTRPATTLPPSTTTPPPPAGSAQAFLDAINAQRAGVHTCGSYGTFGPVAPLTWDPRLAASAAAHSADQAQTGIMSHTGSDGSDIGTRIQRQGYYPYITGGENVAYNYPTLDQVMAGWMSSPGHCRNIMFGSFRDVGMAVAYTTSGVPYWTQDFAAQR